jgi:hypothetical protein
MSRAPSPTTSPAGEPVRIRPIRLLTRPFQRRALRDGPLAPGRARRATKRERRARVVACAVSGVAQSPQIRRCTATLRRKVGDAS